MPIFTGKLQNAFEFEFWLHQLEPIGHIYFSRCNLLILTLNYHFFESTWKKMDHLIWPILCKSIGLDWVYHAIFIWGVKVGINELVYICICTLYLLILNLIVGVISKEGLAGHHVAPCFGMTMPKTCCQNLFSKDKFLQQAQMWLKCTTQSSFDARHEKTDLIKVFVVVIHKEGLAGGAPL